MKRDRIIYWIATGLLSLMMLGSAGNYFFNYAKVESIVNSLGFPSFIIYPLGIAKFLGVIAILSNKSQMLKEWAYAGFFFNFLLAFSGHLNANDNEWAGTVVAMILLFTSYIFDKRGARSMATA